MKEIDEKVFWSVIFAILVSGMIILFLYTLTPIYTSLAIAVVFVYLLRPIVNFFENYLKNRLVSLLLTAVILIIPTALFLSILTSTLSSELIKLSKHPYILEILKFLGIEETITQIYSMQFEYSLKNLGEIILQISNYKSLILSTLQYLGNVLKSVGSFALQLFLGMFFAAYFLIYEKNIVKYLHEIKNKKIKNFLKYLNLGTHQVVYSMFLTGIITGLISVFIYLYFKIPFVAILSILTGFFAMIPVVGGWVVYVPITVYVFLKEGVINAFFFWLVCYFFISTLPDIVVRPLVAGREVGIMPIIIGIFAGIPTFGAVGIILGPLIILVFIGFFKIFVFDEKIKVKEKKDYLELVKKLYKKITQKKSS